MMRSIISPRDIYRRLALKLRRHRFKDSMHYWEKRYASGGHSGAGSQAHLAEFKAEFLNDFVKAYDVKSVVELGCGDGRQLSLSRYPKYTGVDVSETAIKMCVRKYREDITKNFTSKVPTEIQFDLAISLDVLYHLIEEEIYKKYMIDLFGISSKWVIIYSSNYSMNEFQEKFEQKSPHVFHRKFTDTVKDIAPNWKLVNFSRNKYPFVPERPTETSFADFYVYEKDRKATCSS